MVRNPLTISHSDIDALKGELEKIDNGEFTASVYPGLIYSTFQYEYESQLLDEDGNPTIVLETSDETNAELSSLNTLIAAGKANKDDIESLFKNTLKNGLYYYSYIVPSSEEKIEPYCKRVWMDGNYNEQREKIFLRYGENAAKKYEIKDNQNTAVEFTSPECLYLLNPSYKTNIEGLFSSVDTVIENSNRLLTSAKNSGNNIVTVNDNSGEYNYKTGYIYTKFPRYEGKPEVDYLTAREIEIMIEDIVDRADIVDKVLGYKMDDVVGGTIMASGEWDTWKQFDSAWKDLQMDDYGDTMHHYGCFLTTIAMSIAKSAKHIVINSFNPGNLLIAARNANLLNESGAVKSVSGVIKVATGNTNHTVESAPLSGTMTDKANQIARYINEGYDVILRVKSNESERILASQKIYNAGNEHYVLVTGVENGIIHIADPGYNIESIPSDAAKNYINEGLVRVTLIKYF